MHLVSCLLLQLICILSLWSFSLQGAEGKARGEENESDEMSGSLSQKNKGDKKKASKDDEEFRPITGSVWFYILQISKLLFIYLNSDYSVTGKVEQSAKSKSKCSERF